MSWQSAAAPGSTNSGLFDGGWSWGLVLIGIVALLALTAVCTFGILARVRDRAADRKSLAAMHRPVQHADQSAESSPAQPSGRRLDNGSSDQPTQ